ncbi:TPA: hypothetical protein L5T32_004175 [Pseudomonas aeruginosa]|nr:hypothetical protein [Pseudomonas aeruginosa]
MLKKVFRKIDYTLHALCLKFYRLDFYIFLEGVRYFSSIFLAITVFVFIYTGRDYSTYFAIPLLLSLFALNPDEYKPGEKEYKLDTLDIISALIFLCVMVFFLAIWMLEDRQWMYLSGVVAREITPTTLGAVIQNAGYSELYSSLVFSTTCIFSGVLLSAICGAFIYPFRLIATYSIYFLFRAIGYLAQKTSPLALASGLFYVVAEVLKSI